MMKNVLLRRFIQAVVCPLALIAAAPAAKAQQNSIDNFDVTQSGGQVIGFITSKYGLPFTKPRPPSCVSSLYIPPGGPCFPLMPNVLVIISNVPSVMAI